MFLDVIKKLWRGLQKLKDNRGNSLAEFAVVTAMMKVAAAVLSRQDMTTLLKLEATIADEIKSDPAAAAEKIVAAL